MFNEARLSCFLTLVKTRNFSKTAGMLHMTQQAVSKHIAKLEDELGFKLFIRSHNSLTLTPAGENFHQLFSRMEREYRETMENTKNYYNALAKTICLGVVDSLDIAAHLNTAIRSFKDIYPGVSFSGERHFPLELNNLLLEKKLDLIITHKVFVEDLPEVDYNIILEGPMMLLVAAESPLATDDFSLHQFQDVPFLFGNLGGKSIFETTCIVKKICAIHGFPSAKIMILPNYISLDIAVEMGLGVAFSSPFNKIVNDPALRKYALKKNTHVACAWHKNTENPSTTLFAEYLKRSR